MPKDKQDEKPMSISDLNQLYNDADSSLSALFSEQRSNILLTAGQHYAKRGSAFYNNVRNSSNLNKDQKVRLTKNHTQKITKGYTNNLLRFAPGCGIRPKNQSEYHDQQVAEMHSSVWADLKKRKNYERMRYLLIKDFVEIGEAIVKTTFDNSAGEYVPFVPDPNQPDEVVSVDQVQTNPSVFTGDVDWERVQGFNFLTAPSARSWDESPYGIIRKMVPVKDLKAQFSEDEEKQRYIESGGKQTYMLFDSSDGSYKSDSNGLVMVREYYFKSCSKYPHGYYFITTQNGILHEGELPHGRFPIRYVGFDEASTSARSFSLIKQIRPYQAEINRCASTIVEHQLTVGSDKMVLQNGSTATPGLSMHGIKTIKASGEVTYLPGRTGDQFVDYMNAQITEMYMIANYEEDSIEKAPENLDAYALLFRSIKDKKKFIIYAEKLKEFFIGWCEDSLFLAKRHYSPDMIVQVLDKKEMVNIPEFKSSDDISFEIVIEEEDDDVETKLGQQLALNHLVQFVGANLSSQDLGQLVKSMPFVNDKEIFSDLTMDYENARSDILAMDRGVYVQPANPDNHQYIINKLTHRMKMKDFQFLHPEIQDNYQLKKEQHEQILLQQQQDSAKLTSGFVPSGGFLVKCDVRIPDPEDQTKTKILKLPVEALSWLVDKLEKQGSTQQMLQSLEPSAQAEMGNISAINLGQGDASELAG